MADRIAVDHTRGIAYGDLAVALQDAGRHADSRRAMADALYAAAWPELIVPLGAIDPDAVHAVADVVLTDPSRDQPTPPLTRRRSRPQNIGWSVKYAGPRW